jgi:chemotaxis protein CheC
LNISLPEIIYGSGSEIFSRSPIAVADSAVLFLYINFSVRHRDIHGYIAMLMDLPSLTALKALIGKMIERATVESTPNHATH